MAEVVLVGQRDFAQLAGRLGYYGFLAPGIGTGKATAVVLAREGASVLLVDLYPERAAETLEMIEAERGKAQVFAGDVAKAGRCEEMAAAAVPAFGGLDILVNNVGRAFLGTVVDTTEEAWDLGVRDQLAQRVPGVQVRRPADRRARRRVARQRRVDLGAARRRHDLLIPVY